MNRTSLIAALALLALAGVCSATIINVPEDKGSIGAAVSAADPTDTVLVAPGTYTETVNIGSKQITVASLLLTTGDQAYIDSTVIDGNGRGSVVKFSNDGGQGAVLSGFTIQNGASQYGGGIYISAASPTLSNLVIRDCEATDYGYGGGVYCYQSEPTLTQCRIINCISGYRGGALSVENDSAPILENVEMVGNEAGYYGGAVYLGYNTLIQMTGGRIADNYALMSGAFYGYGYIYLTGCVIQGNTSSYNGAIYAYGSNVILRSTLITGNESDDQQLMNITASSLELINVTMAGNGDCGVFVGQCEVNVANSILWNDSPNQISADAGGNTATVLYSDVRDGEDGINMMQNDRFTWGDGNLGSDPKFVDSDGGELRLWPTSPCIDTGDPEQDPDPDGTRADMGAIPFSQSSFVVGRVTSSLDDSPVLGAVVVTSYGDSTMSYYRGEYILNRAMYDFGFSMKASASGYADQDVVGIWLTKNDTLTQNFALPQPLLTPSQDFVVRDLEPGGDWSDVFTLTNAGNWDVDWQVERRVAEADLPVWSLYGSHSIGFWLQDTRLQGVAYGNDHFYVAGGGRDTCYIYVYDHEMNLVAQYPQCGDAAIGFRDLEWDGALLWGAGARMVYGFTPEGEVIQSWRGPYSANQALAWDTDRDLLWIAALPGDDIYGYDSYGNPVTSIPQNGLRIFGLAYYPLDPDGYCLYAMDSPDLNSQVIHKINPENGDTMFVARLEPPGGGLPAGLYISDEYVQFAWMLMAIANNGFRDRVDIWYLGSDPSWLSLTPTSGRISSFTRKDLALDLSAAELDTGIYEAILHFELTNVHSVLSVPVTMQVAVNAAPEPGELQPLEFGINQIYPNPFNGKAVIRYGLAKSGDVKLSVYDLSGRLVRTLQEGEAAPGRYSLTWNAAGLPSGVYVVKLEAGGNQFYAKAALIR